MAQLQKLAFSLQDRFFKLLRDILEAFFRLVVAFTQIGKEDFDLTGTVNAILHAVKDLFEFIGQLVYGIFANSPMGELLIKGVNDVCKAMNVVHGLTHGIMQTVCSALTKHIVPVGFSLSHGVKTDSISNVFFHGSIGSCDKIKSTLTCNFAAPARPDTPLEASVCYGGIATCEQCVAMRSSDCRLNPFENVREDGATIEYVTRDDVSAPCPCNMCVDDKYYCNSASGFCVCGEPPELDLTTKLDDSTRICSASATAGGPTGDNALDVAKARVRMSSGGDLDDATCFVVEAHQVPLDERWKLGLTTPPYYVQTADGKQAQAIVCGSLCDAHPFNQLNELVWMEARFKNPDTGETVPEWKCACAVGYYMASSTVEGRVLPSDTVLPNHTDSHSFTGEADEFLRRRQLLEVSTVPNPYGVGGFATLHNQTLDVLSETRRVRGTECGSPAQCFEPEALCSTDLIGAVPCASCSVRGEGGRAVRSCDAVTRSCVCGQAGPMPDLGASREPDPTVLEFPEMMDPELWRGQTYCDRLVRGYARVVDLSTLERLQVEQCIRQRTWSLQVGTALGVPTLPPDLFYNAWAFPKLAVDVARGVFMTRGAASDGATVREQWIMLDESGLDPVVVFRVRGMIDRLVDALSETTLSNLTEPFAQAIDHTLREDLESDQRSIGDVLRDAARTAEDIVSDVFADEGWAVPDLHEGIASAFGIGDEIALAYQAAEAAEPAARRRRLLSSPDSVGETARDFTALGLLRGEEEIFHLENADVLLSSTARALGEWAKTCNILEAFVNEITGGIVLTIEYYECYIPYSLCLMEKAFNSFDTNYNATAHRAACYKRSAETKNPGCSGFWSQYNGGKPPSADIPQPEFAHPIVAPPPSPPVPSPERVKTGNAHRRTRSRILGAVLDAGEWVGLELQSSIAWLFDTVHASFGDGGGTRDVLARDVRNFLQCDYDEALYCKREKGMDFGEAVGTFALGAVLAVYAISKLELPMSFLLQAAVLLTFPVVVMYLVYGMSPYCYTTPIFLPFVPIPLYPVPTCVFDDLYHWVDTSLLPRHPTFFGLVKRDAETGETSVMRCADLGFHDGLANVAWILERSLSEGWQDRVDKATGGIITATWPVSEVLSTFRGMHDTIATDEDYASCFWVTSPGLLGTAIFFSIGATLVTSVLSVSVKFFYRQWVLLLNLKGTFVREMTRIEQLSSKDPI